MPETGQKNYSINQGMDRRSFLQKTGMMLAASGIASSALSKTDNNEKPQSKPNILLIMSDQHNAGVLGSSGNSIIQTPHLDSLANQGVVFDNCYCNSPLCVPSRLSFTSGKYISRTGAWSNSCWLPSNNYPSLPRIMNRAGYHSVLYGKMHYDPTRTYGFREMISHARKVKTGKETRRRPDDLTPLDGIASKFDQFQLGEAANIKHDRNVTANTIDFLSKRQSNDKPFFLLAGYKTPHPPLTVPEEFWRNYENKIPMPVIPEGHFDSQPLNYKHLRIAFNVEDVPDRLVNYGRELYYGLTQWLDTEIGKVLSSLQNSAVADNTVVIYTTDHGANIGDHGLWSKNSMYEQSCHVPLIINWPARWAGGQRRTETCSLVDLVKTIARLGNATVPEDWDGDTMLPWLDNANKRWKDRAICEYYAHNIASGYVMLRMGQFKYVYHTQPDTTTPSEKELYDLENDPGEFENIASLPKYRERIHYMHTVLREELGESPDDTEQRCRKDYSTGYNREDVEEKEILRVNAPYPNPLKESTTLDFYLESETKLTVSIHNGAGKLVRTLYNNYSFPDGLNRITWDGKSVFSEKLPAGVYFFRLSTSKNLISKKVIIAEK